MPPPHTEPFHIELPPVLEKSILRLAKEGASCRIVGGSVRDALLGIPPKDFDVEVYGLDLDHISEILSSFGKTNLVGRSFAVVKLWAQGEEFDFAIPRRESKTGPGHRGFAIHADAHLSEKDAIQRRDFTLNALLYDPVSRLLIDHVGGKKDLNARILRHISPAFAEDPLRVLRAMQFAGRFGMTLAPETASFCYEMKHEYASLAKERIWGEWSKWAAQSRYPAKGLQALKDSGWIVFYPELNALLRCPQDPHWHPEGDVWTHIKCCTEAMRNQTRWQDHDTETRQILSFGVLCHDLGKARCTRFAEKQGELRWVSPGHDQAGVPLCQRFLTRIGAPSSFIEKVPKLVANHHVLNSAPDAGLSDASLRRLAKRLSPATVEELIIVMYSDHLGRPPRVSEIQSHRLALLEKQVATLEIATEPPQPIMQGRHLIAKGMTPGIAFKAILDQAFEAQLDGAFHDIETGTVWLDHFLREQTQ